LNFRIRHSINCYQIRYILRFESIPCTHRKPRKKKTKQALPEKIEIKEKQHLTISWAVFRVS
jgi:hypothetical protein